jgi:hypothetical protein
METPGTSHSARQSYAAAPCHTSWKMCSRIGLLDQDNPYTQVLGNSSTITHFANITRNTVNISDARNDTETSLLTTTHTHHKLKSSLRNRGIFNLNCPGIQPTTPQLSVVPSSPDPAPPFDRLNGKPNDKTQLSPNGRPDAFTIRRLLRHRRANQALVQPRA